MLNSHQYHYYELVKEQEISADQGSNQIIPTDGHNKNLLGRE